MFFKQGMQKDHVLWVPGEQLLDIDLFMERAIKAFQARPSLAQCLLTNGVGDPAGVRQHLSSQAGLLPPLVRPRGSCRKALSQVDLFIGTFTFDTFVLSNCRQQKWLAS